MSDNETFKLNQDAPPSAKKAPRPKDTTAVKIIKGILYFAIISTIAMVAYSFTVREAMREESENMIAYINRVQDLYYSMSGQFHFTKKTSRDDTLGVDMSDNRFFTAFSVSPNADGDRYQIRFYGRTNAFSIAIGDIKRAVFKRK